MSKQIYIYIICVYMYMLHPEKSTVYLSCLFCVSIEVSSRHKACKQKCKRWSLLWQMKTTFFDVRWECMLVPHCGVHVDIGMQKHKAGAEFG